MEINTIAGLDVTELIEEIHNLVKNSRNRIKANINTELLVTYWNIGKVIIEKETNSNVDDQTSRKIILQISKILTERLGKGFSRANLFNMRKLYLHYSRVQTLSGHLSWSKYCELLMISDSNKRAFYEKECQNANWSVRELKRQIDSSLFERLLLSQGKNNKDKIIKLAQEGNIIREPDDITKDPYVFEFLGIPENKPILEKDLERKLIRHIEDFLLELGKGFMFLGSQQIITINNTHYFVDMVFYNKILKSYVLIELKTRKLQITDGGQMNTYLNYYKTEVNEENDNPPIGIIICAEKDEIAAEYILGSLSNKVFASRYTYILPKEEQLIHQIEEIIINEG
ncbi:MAG: PDDEXK nuclease domain-containing protein [Candidatus Cloacimonadales bacterium]|nr:PDDEXK nuclease domain-containing protein [Candidatus Cloacimonadales bacterium]